ncbi:TetR/AcrR family transcriptional regulator [Thermostaphylospora chromogena]|uniref:Tetracyclin repressor-like C-terminal group 31 domain-containing protein n=1 Tax=Thermostaphylospora chromogena TaxID=35622 RepID=A0A1H1A0U1_9ACTN|nr:TetR/AcrR family transcriptional regulator [Thermostaphylospora chromogena]SDQ33263.1 hypothetical protein SAMN04489764_0255 [Thermostaphylospora chromogena]
MLSPRARLAADAAIGLLVERGMRGLTHRAVDEAAGLPQGSTSNLARTRAALLEMTLLRLTELEGAVYADVFTAPGPPSPPPAPATRRPGLPPETLHGLAEAIGGVLHRHMTTHRDLLLARYELALEATRRPELRVIYDRMGARFRGPAIAVLTAAGSPDPVRHGNQIVAIAEGFLFDAVAGSGPQPSRADLVAAFRELLHGMLGHAPGPA